MCIRDSETDAVVEVGQTFAVIETDQNVSTDEAESNFEIENLEAFEAENSDSIDEVQKVEAIVAAAKSFNTPPSSNGTRFYSPLVKNIAKKEGISQIQLDQEQ